MNRLLIVATLMLSTAPLYAQGQQPNVAKLKADARNVVGIIGSDKTKTQTYCQISDLSEQLIQAVQEKDRKKANALAEKIAESYKKMGCPCRKLNPDVLVVQSAQDWHRQYATEWLDGARRRRSLFKDRCVRVRL
jgi:hypothetical protein